MLNDLPDLGMANRETRSLGAFNPNLVGHYFTLMTRRGAPPAAAGKTSGSGRRRVSRQGLNGVSISRTALSRSNVIAYAAKDCAPNSPPRLLILAVRARGLYGLGGERLDVEQKDLRVARLANQLN